MRKITKCNDCGTEAVMGIVWLKNSDDGLINLCQCPNCHVVFTR